MFNIEIQKIIRELKDTGKIVVKFFKNHKAKFLAGICAAFAIDNICIRKKRKKDQKIFEENSVKHKKALMKHEAEINVLKKEAKQAQEIKRKIDKLEQLINSKESDASE